jgi:hypothetical protein
MPRLAQVPSGRNIVTDGATPAHSIRIAQLTHSSCHHRPLFGDTRGVRFGGARYGVVGVVGEELEGTAFSAAEAFEALAVSGATRCGECQEWSRQSALR